MEAGNIQEAPRPFREQEGRGRVIITGVCKFESRAAGRIIWLVMCQGGVGDSGGEDAIPTVVGREG